MKNLSSESFWSSLETPLPMSVAFVPNASVEVGQLQKENQFLTIALVGLGIVAGVALIYFVFEENRREMQRRIA
jgi:EamA domain-containing membrane protein RarD